MNTDNQYQDGGYDPYDNEGYADDQNTPTAVVSLTANRSQFMSPAGTTRRSRQLARRTEEKMELNHSKARISYDIMNVTAVLSKHEEHLSGAASTGKHRYKAVVDSFTTDAIKQNMDWR